MRHKILKILVFIFIIIFVLALAIGSYGYKKVDDTVNLMQTIDKEEVKKMTNPNISEEVKTTLKDNWTVALFGIDSRDDEDLSSSNSDVIIIASVNNKTGDIKLASVYRDTCLKTGNNKYRKVNEAYSSGGPKKAVEVLNENFDLQIDDYVAVNWSAVANAINILGGVDIELTDKELFYINGYITETVNSTGIGSVQLKHSGFNHLDGIQAVAYCRIRYTDNDFKRTERQRLVLSLLLEKAKKTDWATINNVIVTVFPKISSSIDTNDAIYLGRNILKYNLKDTTGFPFEHKEKRVDKLDYVFPESLETNVSELHKFLYNVENYEPSKQVKIISNSIKNKENGNLQTKTEYHETKSEIKETQAVKETLQETEEYKNIEETTSEETIEETSEMKETEETMENIDIIEETKPEHYGPGYVNTEESEELNIEETNVTEINN